MGSTQPREPREVN